MLFNPFVTEVCLSICWPSGHGTVVFFKQEVALSCVEIKQHLLSWHVLTWLWGLSSAGSRTDTAEKRLQTIKCFSFHLLCHRTHADCELSKARQELPPRPKLYHREENEKTESENKLQFRAAERAGGSDWVSPESQWTLDDLSVIGRI